MANDNSLSKKVHRPIVALSLVCFVILGIASYVIIEKIVFNSVRAQAQSTTDIFTDSIREDILIGLDSEVFRKCQSILRDTLVASVKVVGLDERTICFQKNIRSSEDLVLNRKIYFDPQKGRIAGSVEFVFNSSLGQVIVSRILFLIIFMIAVLLLGYWIVSNFLVKNETEKFGKLADLLRESNIDKLELCSSYFGPNRTRELDELCTGVERLSKNWRAYQVELVRNENLKAVNESSRLLAHDIKSPLGALKTVYQIFDEKPEMSKGLLKKGIVRIEMLVTDLVSKDENMDSDMVAEPVNIEEWISNLKEELSVQYENAGKNVNFTFTHSVDPRRAQILFARRLVERTILNLVKNSREAIGEAGGELKLSITSDSQVLNVIVEDNGPGIQKNILETLGDYPIKSNKQGGSGLGVYQVKKGVESLGGSFSIKSNPSDGTCIHLKIPIKYVGNSNQ